MSSPAGDGLVGDASIRVDADTDPALRALRQFSRDADGRLRDVRGRFVSESALINRSLVNAAGGGDRLSLSLRSISGLAGSIGAVGARLGVIAAQLGAAVPAAAAVAATLANIAPAAGLAATGILAVGTAAAAVKIGMMGVSDAVAAAFDPSDPEKYAAALAKLSPNARAFVAQLHSMQPAFATLRSQVQDSLFERLDSTFKRTAAATLPQLSTAVRTSATTLNQMARGALDAATSLGTSGALGTALGGATRGLQGLTRLPALVVQALGQVAAAAAPSFERLGKAAEGPIQRISEGLTKAFQSGAMQKAIENAITLIGQLGKIFGNVASIAGNVFKAAQVSGGGLIGTLTTITGALSKAFGSPQVQAGLQALFGTMSTLATTAAPLLGQALAVIAPVLAQLGPPVQRLIGSLGDALGPIITNLGPVLTVAAGAVGKLLDALSPLLPVIGDLIASLLPPLIPAITAIGNAFQQAGPVVQVLAQTLATALAPILAQLPAIITPLAGVFTMLVNTLLPVLQRLIIALAPSLAQIGVAFGQVLVALGPLITAIGAFIGGALVKAMPVINTVVGLIGRLAAVFAGELVATIQSVVVPAINVITRLLRGDFSGAWDALKKVFSGVLDTLKRRFIDLPGQLFGALATLAGFLKSRAVEAGSALVGAIRDKLSTAVDWVKGLPGRAASALGSLGGRLVSAGRDLIQGMINGIKQKVGDLVGAAKSVVSSAIDGAKNLLGISSPSKVFSAIGKDTGAGFIQGLTGTQSRIEAAVQRVAGAVPDSFTGADGSLSLAPAALGVGAMRTGGGAQAVTVVYNISLENRGAIGSRRDMEDWLTETLDRLRLQGRLPL